MQLIALLPVLAFLGTVSAAPAALEKRKALKRCRARTTTTAAASQTASPTDNAGGDYAVQPTASSASSAVASPFAAASSAADPSPSSAAAPAASSSSAPSTGGGSSNNGANSGSLTPNGKKAGVSAGNNLAALGSHIGWWYNWSPTEDYAHSDVAQFVPTLWGGGTTDATDSERLAKFQSISNTPQWIIGPNEPDCAAGGGMSAGMSIDATAALWNQYLVPHGNAGSLLLSPSMCHQIAEDGWLKQFQGKINRDFDITNVHINKNSIEGVKASLDYYWNTYQKPIWVTEFACVDDSTGFVPCTDQAQISNLIPQIVDLFENDDRVYAYAYSNGYGLGNVWPLWSQDGSLSQSGQAYLNAISKYH